MTTPKQIADGLSEAQRRALLSLPRIGGNNPGREFTSLLDLGLADCTVRGDDEGERWHVTATGLGLAVRAALGEGE